MGGSKRRDAKDGSARNFTEKSLEKFVIIFVLIVSLIGYVSETLCSSSSPILKSVSSSEKGIASYNSFINSFHV